MFTVTVPSHMLYEATTYLQHNGQYINQEYYRSQATNGDYTYTFSNNQTYQAFRAFTARRLGRT